MSHTTGRQTHLRFPRRRLCAAFSVGLLAPVLLGGCGESQADTNRIRLDSQPLTAVAKAVRHSVHEPSARIVDAGADYAARHGNVKQAVVLVDQRAGKHLSPGDFRRHPVVVRYTSIDAAKHAVDGLPTDRFARVHATVLLLPAAFPHQKATRYRKALLWQAFPADIPGIGR